MRARVVVDMYHAAPRGAVIVVEPLGFNGCRGTLVWAAKPFGGLCFDPHQLEPLDAETAELLAAVEAVRKIFRVPGR